MTRSDHAALRVGFKRVEDNIDRIAARETVKTLSSMEVIVRKATLAELEDAANRDAVRPMDRLLAQPIRCRDGRTG